MTGYALQQERISDVSRRFYVDAGAISGDTITITGEDVNHIKNVLRKREGEELLISSGNGLVYTTKIKEETSDHIACTIIDCNGGKAELPAKIVLFQGLPKKDKMDLIVQKAVELGAAEIVPVVMERTIVKLEDRKKEEKRLQRWNTIALTAAKQSGRDIIPPVSDFVTFDEAVKRAASFEMNLIPYENEKGMAGARELVKEAAAKKTIGIFIGPEGGITDEELKESSEICNAKPMTLGHRILRTETAGLALLSVLMFNVDPD